MCLRLETMAEDAPCISNASASIQTLLVSACNMQQATQMSQMRALLCAGSICGRQRQPRLACRPS